MCSGGCECDICYVLSEWGVPFEWACWGPWLMWYTAESPGGPISSYSLHYCHRQQPWWRAAQLPRPSLTCPVGGKKRQTGRSEWEAALPRWKAETARCFNTALSPGEIAPILKQRTFGIHQTPYHLSFSLSPRRLVLSANNPLGMNESRRNSIELPENIYMTTQYNIMCSTVRAAGSLLGFVWNRCKISLLPFLSQVTNDFGLVHRCNTDMNPYTKSRWASQCLQHNSAAQQRAGRTKQQGLNRGKTICQTVSIPNWQFSQPLACLS